MKNIFLIGFMGSGKSTIAAELQKEIGMNHREMDQMLVEQQKMPITEIFQTKGEEAFRDMESQLLKELSQEQNNVVSCGGGAVLRKENVACMKENGCVVLLTANPESIFARVKNSQDRPVLNGNMNVAYIAQLMEKRRDCYESAADIIVATDGKTTAAICEEIIEKTEQYLH